MKKLLSFGLFFLLLTFLATETASAQSATESIQKTVDRVLDLIKQPGMKNPRERGPIVQKIEDEIKTIFDFSEFSARTVGPKWQQFTATQKAQFQEAFTDLLRATYIDKLSGYSGEKVAFTGEISNAKGDKVEVQSSIKTADKDIPVAYRLLLKNDAWHVYDVRIEKVSLIENYRGQFKELLLKNDIDQFITMVEAKAKEVDTEPDAAK